MARTADPNVLGRGGPPKIEWDDMEDDAVIVTIDTVETGEDEQETPPRPWVRFSIAKEDPDDDDEMQYCHYLNKTQMEYLIEALGSDDMDDWEGKEVPLERVRKQYGKKEFKKVWVAPPESWEGYGLRSAVAKKPRRARAKTTKTKRTKTKRTKRSR